MDFPIDTVKIIADMGLGAVALFYAHRVGRVLEKHEARIRRLENSVAMKPRKRTK